MKTTAKILFVISLFVLTFRVNAQPWMENVKSDRPTLQEIQKVFYDYWKDKTVEKGKGYKQFKRWEWYWEPRILPNGEFPSPSVTWDEWKEYIKTHPETANKMSSAANWTFKGPSTTPGGYNGLGRLNCIAFHPTDIMTMWVGSPAGGLWKTTNQGLTWTTNTDNLPVLGVSDIAIDPTNANIMYIATGDGDMGSLYGNGDTKSIGILKSIDGGSTWNTTGMNWSVTSAKLIRRLIINPNNPQILIAAASDGIWRTTNGGSTWTNVQSGYFMDLEFKPSDPTIVYASTFAYGNAQIFRSTNSGGSWTSVATLSGVLRINLAVTPDWPDLVDALCANTQSGLAGLWYSSNSGASFTQYFTADCTNNLLHISYNASGCDGQGHYDLAYAINPSNSDDIWLGGVNTWNSTNGGSNWSLKTIWTNGFPTSASVVHADKHFFAFHPLNSNLFYECNDGGLYATNDSGTTWYDLSDGLQISQIYRIGVSQTVTNNIICGLQDNGSREIYNNSWYEQTGGDGMECIIDYTNANTEYASYAYGKIYRTYDFWVQANITTISSNIPLLASELNPITGAPAGAWVTPFVIHPTNPQILFAGYKRLYKTTDQGNSWSAISPVLTSDLLRSVAVAPSNPNTIYTATFDTLYLTTNGGTNWSYVALGIPNAKITYIAVHPTNSQTVWITLSGYSSGQKVYKTIDGGVNWTNISGTLPNLPVNCIVYQNGSNDGLYIGTDAGVFYRDATLTNWITYQTGLPNVVVTELEISYNNNKLWAATFGRGLWNSDLYLSSVGIETENTNNFIHIFQNPNSGQFTVQVPENKLYDISVFNVLGERVLEDKQINSSQRTINLSNVNAGVYFVHVTIDNKTITKKIIINK